MELQREPRAPRWNAALRARGYVERGRRRSVTPVRITSRRQRIPRPRSLAASADISQTLEPLEIARYKRAHGSNQELLSPGRARRIAEEMLGLGLTARVGSQAAPSVAGPSRAIPPAVAGPSGRPTSSRIMANVTSPGRPGDMVALVRYASENASPNHAGAEVTQDVHGTVYNWVELTAQELADHPLRKHSAESMERSLDDYSSPSPLPVPAQDDSGQPAQRSIFECVRRKRNPVKRRHAYTPPKRRRTAMKRRCTTSNTSPKKKAAKRAKKNVPPETDNNSNNSSCDSVERLRRALSTVSVRQQPMRAVKQKRSVDLDRGVRSSEEGSESSSESLTTDVSEATLLGDTGPQGSETENEGAM